MVRKVFWQVLALVLVAGGAATAGAQGSTALTTQDHIDIQHLYARYNQTIDSDDAEGWAGTFRLRKVSSHRSCSPSILLKRSAQTVSTLPEG